MKNIQKVLLASALMIPSIAFAGFTWTPTMAPQQIYVTQGCNSNAGDAIAVVTLPGHSTQYAFNMADAGAKEMFNTVEMAIISGKQVHLNYNNSASNVTYDVVRHSACGSTNPMIKITGAALNN